jgi:hypothetical protein
LDGRRGFTVVVLLALALSLPGVAHAAPSGPATIGGTELDGIACPSITQCTALDAHGREMTFNPASPGTPAQNKIDSDSGELESVACPSTTQCTAVDWSGREVTFNPTSPGTPSPVTIDAGIPLWDIACPSTTQCTAVGDNGYELTFNPASPGTPPRITIDGSNELHGVACPSRTQCTAVGDQGHQVTFNPTSPGTPTPTTIDTASTYNPATSDPNGLLKVACPSRTQCTAVDFSGHEVTFNLVSPGTPTPILLGGLGEHKSIACPTSTQCTAIEYSEGEITFNPKSPDIRTPVTTLTSSFVQGVACPSSTQCTAVIHDEEEVTFNPNPTSTSSKGPRPWTPAQCKRTYKTWIKKHHRATHSRRKAEANTLHKHHGCLLTIRQ